MGEAQAQVQAVVGRSPISQGIERSRWWLAGIGQQIEWFKGAAMSTIWRTLKALQVVYKRGRSYLHSPDPDYATKLAYIAACVERVRTDPGRYVLLYEDELTYYRRATVSSNYVLEGSDGPRAEQGWTRNRKGRIAAALDLSSGRVLSYQATILGRRALGRFYQQIEAAYPQAERIFLVLDNWPVHFHADLIRQLTASRIELVRLPTYAPWTNPVEKLWRKLYAEILHLHPFGDHWSALQQAIQHWLAQYATGSSDLLRYVGLYPP